MFVADRYGWHRDELYYLASSRHLSLGYVDYPPVTPLLARLDQLLFPGSLPGLRLLTVLAGAGGIGLAPLVARGRGGGRPAPALYGPFPRGAPFGPRHRDGPCPRPPRGGGAG